MKFDDVKPGMVFDNKQPPRFIYIRGKDTNSVSFNPINYNTDINSKEYAGKIHYMDWEDQFEELERVDATSPDSHNVFRELFE